MAPAITPAAQVGRAATPIDREGCWYFADGEAVECGPHHHLARKLHTRRAQIEPEDSVAVKAAQAAVEVAYIAAEEDAPDRGEHRIAQVAVQWRHGTGGNPTAEAVAHHQIGTGTKLIEEWLEPGKVVAIIGIAHDHVASTGSADAGHECATITTASRDRQSGTVGQGDGRGFIGASIVGNNDFTDNLMFVQKALCLDDTTGEGLSFVEAGHHDREFAGRSGGA